MLARGVFSFYPPRLHASSCFPSKSFVSPTCKISFRNSFVSPTYAKTRGVGGISSQSSVLRFRLVRPFKQRMSARRHLLSLLSQSPLSTLLLFNHLRTLSFSVSYLSAVLPTSSALFHQKPGCTPSSHTNASDGPRLSLRNLFSAFRLSVLCVSAVSPSSLYSPPATSFPCQSPITSVDKQTSPPPAAAACSSDASVCAGRRRALRRATAGLGRRGGKCERDRRGGRGRIFRSGEICQRRTL